jgi:hypothetical protein
MAVTVRAVGPSLVLLIVAVVLFILAAFNVNIDRFTALNVAELGLAAFAAAFIFGP